MLIKCKIESSYCQISFGYPEGMWLSDFKGNPSKTVFYHDEAITISTEYWWMETTEPNITVMVQDFVPTEGNDIFQGTYTITSPTKQFAISNPDNLGEGITFLADKETIEVSVYTDGKQDTKGVILVIQDTDLYVVMPYDPTLF